MIGVKGLGYYFKNEILNFVCNFEKKYVRFCKWWFIMWILFYCFSYMYVKINNMIVLDY